MALVNDHDVTGTTVNTASTVNIDNDSGLKVVKCDNNNQRNSFSYSQSKTISKTTLRAVFDAIKSENGLASIIKRGNDNNNNSLSLNKIGGTPEFQPMTRNISFELPKIDDNNDDNKHDREIQTSSENGEKYKNFAIIEKHPFAAATHTSNQENEYKIKLNYVGWKGWHKTSVKQKKETYV